MEEKFIKFIIILFMFEVATATELVTQSKVHHTSLSFRNEENWHYENSHFVYTNFKFHSLYRVPLPAKSTMRVAVIKDLFRNDIQSYNCTYQYQYDKEKSRTTSGLNGEKFYVAIGSYNELAGTYEFKLMVFDLPTCKVIVRSSPLYGDDVILDQFSNDIYFVNSTLCGSKYCKMTIDSELNIVAGPEPWIEAFDSYVVKYEVKSTSRTDKVYLIIQRSDGFNTRISLLTEKGQKVLLENRKLILASTHIKFTHDVISVIRSNDEQHIDNLTTLQVFRYDLEGNLKLRTDINITGDLQYVEIQNLKNGGFMIFAGKKIDSELRLNITKYDEHGKAVSRTAEIGGFTPYREYTMFDYPVLEEVLSYENEEKMFCFIQGKENPSRKCWNDNCADAIERCFWEEDLELL